MIKFAININNGQQSVTEQVGLWFHHHLPKKGQGKKNKLQSLSVLVYMVGYRPFSLLANGSVINTICGGSVLV